MTPPLIACGHCRAEFLPRRAPCRRQIFCSRRCASNARRGRPSARAADPTLWPFLQLLALGPFERRPRGWRFGTRRIHDRIVAHLVATGRARIEGDRLQLVPREAQP